MVFPRSITPISGLKSPMKIIKVSNTAIWAIILFSFFTPGLHIKRATPTKAGMSAVTDGDSESMYPQAESMISRMALIRLAVCAFMISFKILNKDWSKLVKINQN